MDGPAPRTLDLDGPVQARPGPANAVVLRGVRKAYGPVVAVDSLDLEVPAGAMFALIGPNSAGKTTAVECIEGLRRPDAGSIRVLGLDPVRDHQRLFSRVGALLQEGALPERLRVGEIMALFASLYRRPPEAGRPLLERLNLADHERRHFAKLSGGQKRRLGIALALVGNPELVILDEPTSGLDPQGRHQVWALLREVRQAGVTVLVTTHYLEEAEDHCDLVAIIDHGRVVAGGRPRSLLERHGLGVRLSVRVPEGDGEALAAAVAAAREVTRVERVGAELVVYGRDGAAYDELKRACEAASPGSPDSPGASTVELRAARLEDLFLLLTGRQYRKE